MGAFIMAELARAHQALSRATGIDTDESLKKVAIFCGIGLLISLILASYGLDLSPGFF